MKKTFTAMTTILTVLACTIPFASTTTAFAAKIDNDGREAYYDLNNDGEYTIADLVIADKLVDDGRFAKKDFYNVCDLMFGNDIIVNFNGCNIEELWVDEDTISNIQAAVSSYCVGYEYDGEEVRYRFLNDGTVTELRCANFGISETTVAAPVYDDVLNVIGISPDRKFIIDDYRSFDLPHQFATYGHWNLDETTPYFADMMLHTSGKFENFVVETTSPESTFVRFSFNNGITLTELDVHRIAPIEKEIRTFVYDGEEITVGITADGKVALDTYSFDIAE